MPLVLTTSEALSSPVDGLYSSLAFDVFSVDAVPVVALANRGNKSVDVVVSLASAAPPTEAHTVPL